MLRAKLSVLLNYTSMVRFKSKTQSVEHKSKNVLISLLLFMGAFYAVHGAFKVETSIKVNQSLASYKLG